MAEPLALLSRLNLAVALAVLVVLALRLPLRRLCGAQASYGLWTLVPLTALAMLAPARTVVLHPAAPMATASIPNMAALPAPAAGPTAFDPATLLLTTWLVGALASLVWLIGRQVRFGRAVAQGRAGPAVVGVLKPRIVVPNDFGARYTGPEQRVILAHEAAHIRHHDSRINALVAFARCVAWFNPMLHLMARYLRIDQELACDARVIAAHPASRRAYAEAMLKTQLAATPLPLGCYWPTEGAHPLAHRIAHLARTRPSALRRWTGGAAVVALGAAVSVSAWAARPAQIVVEPAPPRIAPAAPATLTAQAEATPLAPVIRHAPPPPPQPEPTAEPAPAAPEAAPAPPAPVVAAAPDPEAGYRARVRGAAERSSVEPGKAVRVIASLTDLEGHELVTDLTSFGSQSRFRTGSIRRPPGSRYSLFTSVRQDGETLYVTVSLGNRFSPWTSGTIPIVGGGTGKVALPDGQVVTVTASIRDETPEEMMQAARAALHVDDQQREAFLQRASFVRVDADPFRCGRLDALC